MKDHEYAPTVARLRELARNAAHAGNIADAPQHPDHELLEVCATVLDLRAEADAIDREARKMLRANMDNPAFAAEMERKHQVLNKVRSPMARVSKFSAKTAAGIYAKAHVLRASFCGAPQLAKSIADDLINCPGLRSSLWPAEPGGPDHAAA